MELSMSGVAVEDREVACYVLGTYDQHSIDVF